MKKDTSCELMNEEEAVSPVIATILMVAITVVLAGVLYVWASELAGNQTDFGTFNNYVAEDIRPTTSSAVNDPLFRMRFSNGPDDLSWSFLKVSLSGEDGTLSECKIGQVSALGEEINVFNLISDNNAHDLSTQGERNGELPDGTAANWASRLPNNAGFYATAYGVDPATNLANDESFFLSYDFDTLNAGTQDGVGNAVDDDYTYYIYGVNSVSADANDGHTFDVVTSLDSKSQYMYFASQYAGNYVPAAPGTEVLVTGEWDVDVMNTPDDASDDVAMNMIQAVTVNGLAAGMVNPIAFTGAAPSQAMAAMGDIMYFYDNGDGTSTLKSVVTSNDGDGDGIDEGHWTGAVSIQKNNILVGTSGALIFMEDATADSAGGMVTMVNHPDYGIIQAGPTDSSVQGYALGYTNSLDYLIVGQSTDMHLGGANAGGFSLVGIGATTTGTTLSANTAGQGVFGTYATVLNSPTGNTYLYYNALDLVNGGMDVFSYLIAGADADGDSVDDSTSSAQGFEARSGITIDPTSVNFGQYSGVIGVFRQGVNPNGQTVFQLIIMNPDLGISLAFWSDQVGLLSNLAAVLGADSPDPNFNQGFYTQYVHDLGRGSGKIMTTYIDDAGNMDPGLIDLGAMLASMNSGDAAGEATTDAKCIIFQEPGTDDGLWQGTEVLTIYENGFDVCGVQVTSTCELDITVYYKGKVLAGTTSVDVL
jgi:flagellin-like protein